jgi:hypothetical protein
MKRDLIYILVDGSNFRAFGNLKTLLESILAANQYSTVWRLLDAGKGTAEFGAYSIHRLPVHRAAFATK